MSAVNRKGQAAILYGAGGLIFGLFIAPIPNLAAEYVLSGVLAEMDGYFAQHQAGVEGYRMTINQSGPNYMIEEDHIGGQIINECNNTRSFETRFTHSPEGTPQNCLQNHAEAETTDSYPNTHQTYAYHTRIPSVTGFPRISFYELREDDDDDDDGPDYDAYQPTGDRHQGDRLNTLMVDGSTFRQKFEEGDDS